MFKKYPKYKFILAFCDLAIIVVTWLAAIRIRFNTLSIEELLAHPRAVVQLAIIGGYSLLWIVIFQHFHLYKRNLFLSVADQLTAIVKALVYGLVGLIFFTFFIKGTDWIDSRAVLAIFVGLSFISITLFRTVVFRRLFAWASEKKILRHRVLIVGSDEKAQMLAAQIGFDEGNGFEVVGFVDDGRDINQRIFEDLHLLGPIDSLAAVVEREKIEEVIVAKSDIPHDELLDLIDRAKQSKAGVRLVSDLYNIVGEKVRLEEYIGVPIVRVQQNQDSVLFAVYKRVFDFVFAVVGIVLLAVPMAVIAVIIKLTSRGKVLYKHTRIGKGSQPFEFYKFRTMIVDNDDTSHRAFIDRLINEEEFDGVKKITHDPRVTTIGRFLRKTSLDELPQLFNVLQGHMSLVGPRPCLPYELEMYKSWHRRRLSVTPGCTGLWQVSGRSAVGFNDMVILDLFYIENMSPLFDLRIILRTIPVMLLGKGGH
jgi:exopolysaccharide biosynthesis polyprenyl glycosylphosphotransferase